MPDPPHGYAGEETGELIETPDSLQGSRLERPDEHIPDDVAGDRQSEVEIRTRPGSQSITYQDVAIIARHFAVSYEAAAWRLKSLGRLGSSETTALVEQRGSGKNFMKLLKLEEWDEKKIPDDERERELRSQLAWLGVEAYRREEISQGRLREIAGKLHVPAGQLLELAEAARRE
jgi:hypothetical protein